MFVKLIQDHLRYFTFPQVDNNAHTISIRLITEIRDTFNHFILDEPGNIFDDPGFVHLKWEFGYDDTLSIQALVLFNGCDGSQLDHTFPGLISADNTLFPRDKSACREVRPRHDCHQLS